MPATPDPFQHRRLRPASALPVPTASSDSYHETISPLSMVGLGEDHARALAALKQSHGERLARLEERLTIAEQATTDLGGQLRELR